MPDQTVAETFIAYSVKRMRQSERDIRRCCEQLTEEQMWRRGGEHENSVANLLLHLEGNMRQWILHGVGGQADVRQRDEEFTLTPSISGAEALERLSATVEASCGVIGQVTEVRLLEVTDPQPTSYIRYPTVLEAIYQVVGHVQLHGAQIVLLTKQMAGRDLDLSMPRKR